METDQPTPTIPPTLPTIVGATLEDVRIGARVLAWAWASAVVLCVLDATLVLLVANAVRCPSTDATDISIWWGMSMVVGALLVGEVVAAIGIRARWRAATSRFVVMPALIVAFCLLVIAYLVVRDMEPGEYRGFATLFAIVLGGPPLLLHVLLGIAGTLLLRNAARRGAFGESGTASQNP